MKKPKLFLLFLLSLMLSVTAWADEIKVSTDESTPEHVYAIHGGPQNQSVYWGSLGGNVGVSNAALFAFYSYSSTSTSTSTETSTSTSTETNTETSTDLFYIYNITDKTYLSYDQSSIGNGRNKVISAASQTAAKPWKITAVSTNSEYFQMQPVTSDNTAADYYANWKDGVDNITHTSMGFWQTGGSADNGSAWKLEVAEDVTCTLTAEDNTTKIYTKKGTKGSVIYWQWDGSLSDIINLTEEKWGEDNSTYTANIKTSANKYMYGSPSGKICYIYASGTAVKTQLNSLPTNETYKNWEWQFVPTFDSETLCFKIKNMNEEKYIVTSSSASNTDLTLGEESNATKYVYGSVNGGYGFSDKANTDVYISVATSTAGEKNAGAWKNTSTNHKGVNLTFVTPADFDDLKTKLTTAAETAKSIELSTELGKYCTNQTFTDAKTKAAEIIAGTTYATASEFQTLINNLSTSALTVNVPQSGKFYTLFCPSSSLYVLSTSSTAKTDRLATAKESDNNAADRIFYFDGTNMMGYNDGYYAGLSNNFLGRAAVGSTNGTSFAFSSASVADGTLYVKFNSSRYLNAGTEGYVDAGGGTTGNNAEAYCFTVTEVTELPLTIGANGWSSFSAPVDVKAPSDVKVYYAPTAPSDGKLVLEELDGDVIPAKTGVLVSGEEGTTVKFSTETGDATANTLEGNMLQCNWYVNAVGTNVDDDETAKTDGLYAFATNTNTKVSGFMKLLTKITLPGHKCYLNAATAVSPSTGSAQFIPISLTDDPTGIESAETTTVSDSNAPIYDLQGRKVASTTKGGMYIQNGKVFIAM
jgi:hypothetical protein